MGIYGRYSRRRSGSVRRSAVASRFQAGAFPEADCIGCGVRLRYMFGATVPAEPRCEHCEAVKILTDQGVTVPAWAERLLVRDGVVLAFCTGAHGPAVRLDGLDHQGRCPFCALPGVMVPGFDNRKVCGNVLHVRDGNGFYSVGLTPEGRVPVCVLDQSRGWLPGITVPVTETGPAWGTGWQVEDLGTGADVWWMQNWDSSG